MYYKNYYNYKNYQKIKSGDIIKAKVTALKPYGAFIETRDGRAGLIHISEITNCFVFDIHSYLREGEIVEVKVLSIQDNKINATLNFRSRDNKDKKISNSLDTLNFRYGFETLRRNLAEWQRRALREAERNNFIK